MTHSRPSPAPGVSRRGFLKIIAAGGLAVGLGAAGARRWLERQATGVVRETRVLMGTIVNLTVAAPDPAQAQFAVESVFAEMDRWVSILDHRDPASALGRLNAHGRLEDAPHELLEVANRALQIGALSGGAFDISVKPALDAYRLAAQAASPGEPVEWPAAGNLRRLVDYRQVFIDGASIRFGQADMQLTLDGLAKGRVVDAGVAVLRGLGFADILVEAGGDLAAHGQRGDGGRWEVGVQSPRSARRLPLAVLPLGGAAAPAAVATSGDYQHSFTADFTRHHILDPRTLASPTELASATTIASTAMDADALSTTLMVLGVRAGLALVERLPNVEALLVGKDMRVYKSSGIKSS